MKISTLYRCTGDVLPTPHRNITVVVASNNLEKTNPSEIKVKE